jgi:hypothetical protein
MPKRKRNPVIVTRADGSTYEMPAYDRRSLRLIIENPILSDYDRAMLQVACPICNQRAGRVCRTPNGRQVRHRDRIVAYQEQRSTRQRPESSRLES